MWKLLVCRNSIKCMIRNRCLVLPFKNSPVKPSIPLINDKLEIHEQNFQTGKQLTCIYIKLHNWGKFHKRTRRSI